MGNLLNLVEAMKINAFMDYNFNGLMLGDLNDKYTFVKISSMWYKIPNLIIPFFFYLRREVIVFNEDEKRCRFWLCLYDFCCRWNMTSVNSHVLINPCFICSSFVIPKNEEVNKSTFRVGIKNKIKMWGIRVRLIFIVWVIQVMCFHMDTMS